MTDAAFAVGRLDALAQRDLVARGEVKASELVEWARKQPTDTALRTAWVDATRADWLPYVAATRGISTDTILRATCELAAEVAGAQPGPEATRVLALLRGATRDSLAGAEKELADLRTQLVAWSTQTQPTPKPAWMFWAELVFELGRACSRSNPIVGIALARMLPPQADLFTQGPKPLWIWGADDNRRYTLRKEFAGGSTAARLKATCDNRMTVFLNGQSLDLNGTLLNAKNLEKAILAAKPAELSTASPSPSTPASPSASPKK